MLGCTFTPAPSDIGELDIEWYNVRPDMTQKDQLVRLQSRGHRGSLIWITYGEGLEMKHYIYIYI